MRRADRARKIGLLELLKRYLFGVIAKIITDIITEI